MIYMSWFATGAAKAMSKPKPGTGSQYAWTYQDESGQWLLGERHYRFRIPPNPPAKDVWSVIVYDNWTRAILPNGQKVAGKNSYDKSVQSNSDGSIDIYFGPESPAGKESNWIRTVPGKGWFSIFRLYGPLEPWFSRTWTPDDCATQGVVGSNPAGRATIQILGLPKPSPPPHRRTPVGPFIHRPTTYDSRRRLVPVTRKGALLERSKYAPQLTSTM